MCDAHHCRRNKADLRQAGVESGSRAPMGAQQLGDDKHRYQTVRGLGEMFSALASIFKGTNMITRR